MSRGNRKGDTKDGNLNGTISGSNENYEDTIRRMKVLSKAQTTFLKAYLSTKLEAAKDLVITAIDVISKSDDEIAINLRKELKKLKLDEIRVDFTSAELMMQDEMELLRNSIEGHGIGGGGHGSNGTSSNSSSNEKDIAKIKQLETENVNLRGLLKDLRAELLTAGKKDGNNAVPTTPATTTTTTVEVESPALLREVEELRRQVQETNQHLADKTRELKESQKQINSLSNDTKTRDNSVHELQKEINLLRSELNNVTATATSATEDSNNLKKQIKELQAELEKERTNSTKKISKAQALASELESKLTESQNKAEKEKEELMEAMALEVEEVEKKYSAEAAAVATTHAKEVKKLQKSVTKYKNSSKNLSAGLGPLKRNLGDLRTSHRQVVKTVADELNSMQTELIRSFSGGILRKIQALDESFGELNRKYKKEMAERKRLHNVIQELKGNIRVYLRCRPPSTRELENSGADTICVTFPDTGEVRVVNEKGREKTWEFDEVFNLDTTQAQVYNEVSDLVTSVLDGYNVCIFAYGQTGSGKTFTMTGPPDQRGVNTRALDELFEKARQRSDEWVDTITVNVLEVYNEEIHDLLSGRRDEKLEVKQGPQGNYVPGLTQVPVTTNSEVVDLLAVSDRNRSQSCTNMNEHSSRSHMMLTVTITSEHKITGMTSRGKLNLVDLAGSERINKSGATGQALKEAQNINSSLSALGDVIAARGAKQAHVPFRNSTLTYLLQDSLSQDSKTLMFVCISPVIYNAEETFCSLNFAARVRSVELGKASRNVSNAGAANGAKKPKK